MENLKTQNLMIQRNSIQMVKILMVASVSKKWTSKLMGLSLEMLIQVMWELRTHHRRCWTRDCGGGTTAGKETHEFGCEEPNTSCLDLAPILKIFLFSADQHVNNTNNFSRQILSLTGSSGFSIFWWTFSTWTAKTFCITNSVRFRCGSRGTAGTFWQNNGWIKEKELKSSERFFTSCSFWYAKGEAFLQGWLVAVADSYLLLLVF